MSPLPSTAVIPAGWSAHHQPTMRGTLSGRLVARAPASGGEGGWTPEDGPTPGDPGEVLHTGPYRAQPLTDQGTPTEAARQDVTLVDYLVVLDATAPALPEGTILAFEECPDDPALVGQRMHVRASVLASHRFERDVFAILNLTAGGAP